VDLKAQEERRARRGFTEAGSDFMDAFADDGPMNRLRLLEERAEGPPAGSFRLHRSGKAPEVRCGEVRAERERRRLLAAAAACGHPHFGAGAVEMDLHPDAGRRPSLHETVTLLDPEPFGQTCPSAAVLVAFRARAVAHPRDRARAG
jgi:hypothetical protein